MKNSFIIQRFLPSYRREVAKIITQNSNIEYIIGTDVQGSKAKNAQDLVGIRHIKLKMFRIVLFRRELFYQKGLLTLLIKRRPSEVITEAESSLLSYLTVLLYKYFFNRKCKIAVWCFFSLPGEKKAWYVSIVKHLLWRLCDKYLSYHNFGKNYLVSKGFKEEKITVALNVGETQKYSELRDVYDKLIIKEVRNELGFNDRFTIGYVGSFTKAKKPEKLVEISKELDKNDINLIFIGNGPLYSIISNHNNNYKCINWTNNLLKYFCAIDLIILPGRGGIIISEALTLGIPVMVHQADGVELDLINDETGKLIKSVDNADLLKEIIDFKSNYYIKSSLYKKKCRAMIDYKYNSNTMAQAIINCLN